ncbi:MAG: hypothetical protein CMH57_07755 [Myxococcales bacterium]|nr:hypothetical protein [Myxococcales bacterium]
MRNGLKLALGAATVWPLFYIVAFTVAVLSMIVMAPDMSAVGPWPFLVLFPLHLITILGIFGLVAYYIYHLIKNDGLDSTARIIWAIVLVKFNIFAMPVYWYLHVWRARERRRAGPVLDHAADVLNDRDRDVRVQGDLDAFERRLAASPVVSRSV